MSIRDISSSQCWEALEKNSSSAYLIDVRAKEEWKETGIADLSSIAKEVKLISWMFFTPSIHANDKFIDELKEAVNDKNTELFFICKSGGRSAQAAKAAMQNGYNNCFNINDGFVGNMFDDNLEPLKLNGWLNNNLPRKKL